MSVSVPRGYKQTKVGIIPKDWDVVKLDDISYIDKDNLTNRTSQDYKFKYISLSDVNNGIINHELTEYTYKDSPSRARRIVKKNDILMATVRPNLKGFGRYTEDEENIICSTGFSVIRNKKGTLQDYLYYNLFATHIEKQIFSLVVGSNYPAINSSDVKNLKIPLPPLKEQQRIAQILTTWDYAITKQEVLIEVKKELKKGLLQKLLSGEVRLSGFDGEWETVRLKDIASRITIKNTDNSIDMVFSNSAVNGIVIQNEFFDKDIANRDNLTGYYIVEDDDFVYNPRISKNAPAGPINRNRHEFSGIVSPLYTVFRINENEIIDYLEYFFSSTLWFRYMKAIANYGARHDRMNITNSDFMKMPIPYPSREEQQSIAEVLKLADNEIELLKKELVELKEQKKGIMQKLLTGQIRVKV